ncbi:reverse transcriptase family protein [Paraburkholderia sp. BL25I1N1]|uniref:reverse transcriptase family protein n=1 Tax=Paraburkholderia sp. BL25I1N1 TaxID=1938804 RepID=UPI000D06136B|nr:reverse transcriptase family protein [Paraburkholderia sp. BL25I1N1]PRY03115.1 RNA-directed DNA polymerase [Paraburkholderia sp. BL25I1N1]
MSLSSLQHVTYAIADAMLAGPAEPAGMVERMTLALGEAAGWMNGLARHVAKRFAARWDSVGRKELSTVVAGMPGFVSAWRSEQPPTVVRVLTRLPFQRPPPPWLRDVMLPQLPTLGDLAAWLKVEPDELDWFADRWRVPAHSAATPLHHYSYKAIEKCDGRCRIIEIPKSRLRALQRKVLSGLLDRIPAHESAHGFRRGRNIVTFAAPHVAKAVVMRFDLTDFFASVHAGRVYSAFHVLGYPLAVARTLTALCTNRIPSSRLLAPDVRDRIDWQERQRYRNRHLPQGAPTSPALANLCAFRLDVRLAGLARSVGASYTRYADDLAFSGDENLARMAERLTVRVAAIALEEGFSVNLRKTRVMRRGARQHLAGVVVNSHANVARPEFDALKALLTNCARHGPRSQNRDDHADFRAHLAGRVAHVAMVNAARGAKLRALFERVEWDEGSEVGAGSNGEASR